MAGFRENVLLYCVSAQDRAENAYSDMKDFIRFHRSDEVDYLELIITKARRDAINEMTKDIIAILRIRERNNDTKV